jgi:hypothetical protein
LRADQGTRGASGVDPETPMPSAKNPRHYSDRSTLSSGFQQFYRSQAAFTGPEPGRHCFRSTLAMPSQTPANRSGWRLSVRYPLLDLRDCVADPTPGAAGLGVAATNSPNLMPSRPPRLPSLGGRQFSLWISATFEAAGRAEVFHLSSLAHQLGAVGNVVDHVHLRRLVSDGHSESVASLFK